MWATVKPKFARSILVPFAFESPKSGVGDTTFRPWVRYRRAFTPPAEWKGKRVLLNFGAVDYRASVWVNGHFVSAHEGGNVPFKFDVTLVAKLGAANSVVVRAEDPPEDKFIARGKQSWLLKSRGIFYTRISGIWQSVWLEAAGDSYLEKVRTTPSLGGRARFEAKVVREAAVFLSHRWRRRCRRYGRRFAHEWLGPPGGTLSNSQPRPNPRNLARRRSARSTSSSFSPK